jgi:uncharacterized membrane protein
LGEPIVVFIFAVFLVFVAALFIIPILAWQRAKRVERSAATQADLSKLVGRIYALEQAITQLRAQIKSATFEARPPAEASATPSETAHTVASPPPAVQTPSEPPPQSPRIEITPPVSATTPHPSPAPPSSVPSRPAPPVASPSTQPAASLPHSATAPPPPISQSSPSFALSASRPRVATGPASKEQLATLEEKLGANWLNKIGTTAFVIGIALLINYSLRYLGPAGKIALGYGIGILFIALGAIGEKNERYRIGARAILGGGWAIVYFTTYATHNIASVRLIDDPTAGFILLFLVAAAMVAHSLLYESEITTGFAVILAYLTVAISEIPIGALIASAVLSAALVAILRARRWYNIEPFAILAAYTVHFVWLMQIFDRIGAHKPFPEFTVSASLLTIYWLIFIASYFLRPDGDENERRMLAASFLLNALGYLIVLRQQSFHPEWRFAFLLFAGGVYLLVCAAARQAGRRLGFVLGSTLGATLTVIAIPFKYSGAPLELIWLAEAEAFVVAGWRLVDTHLRRLGWAAMGVLSIYVFLADIAPRFEYWRPPDHALGIMILVIAVAIYLNSEWKHALGANLHPIESAALVVSPVVATIFFLAAAWIGTHFMLAGVLWTASAALFLEGGVRRKDSVLRYCGDAAALAAVIRLIVVNMPSEETYNGLSLRVITISAGAAILYLIARRAAPSPDSRFAAPALKAQARGSSAGIGDILASIGGVPGLYTGAATLLLSLLLWHEVTTAGVALAWALAGLLLIEASDAITDLGLRGQGFALIFASFLRIFFVDLNGTTMIGPITSRLLTVSVLTAIYFWASTRAETDRWRAIFLWLGTIAFAALVRFEIATEWVAVGWAAMTVALFAIGRRFGNRTFRDQCYVFALLTAIRCAFDNFYQTAPWHFTNVRIATTVAASLLLYAVFIAIRIWRVAPLASPGRTGMGAAAFGAARSRVRRALDWFELRAHHLFFFTPTILLTILLTIEVRRGYLTAAWGAEALVVFLIVLPMNERAYRWFSLALLLLCVGRIVTVDVWTFDQLGRIVSFLGLGATLLLISFLYARHREILRKVL